MIARRATAGHQPEELFQLLARFLAPHLRHQFALIADAKEIYYDQCNSPLGRRRHLELVRRGLLIGCKTGRKVLVRRDEVHALIDGQRSERGECGGEAEEPLADWGLERGTSV